MGRWAMLDSMVVSYLDQTFDTGYDPADDDEALARERVAALRLFFWIDLAVSRSAVSECLQTRDVATRESLDDTLSVVLPEYDVPEQQQDSLASRVEDLRRSHSGEIDCRLVAEAELLGATWFVSFDKQLIRRLRDESRVPLRTPGELWEELAIPRGTPPIREPDASNPLSGRAFWRWQ